LAKYRAEQRAGSSAGTDKGRNTCRPIHKPETDDEVTDWERTVSYNESILRLDRQQFEAASTDRRNRQSTDDRDQWRHLGGRDARQRDPGPSRTTTNNIVVKRTIQDGRKNELRHSGNADERIQETQKTKPIENPQEKRELQEENTVAKSNGRNDDVQRRQQRSSPNKQPAREGSQSDNKMVEKIEKQTTSDATHADPTRECSIMSVALSQTQSRQSSLSRTASLVKADERGATFSGTQSFTDQTDHVMTSVARDEPDDEDPGLINACLLASCCLSFR